jgi:hypothetical protein
MVIPLDSEFEDLPDGVRTRITLSLLRSTDFAQRRNDLMNIPDTFLLFLTKLRTLFIRICPSSGSQETIIHRHEPGSSGQRSKILKTVQNNALEEARDESRYYHVVTRYVQGLPADEARKHNDKATVVLAFPVDKDDVPIVEEQFAYAFLPLRKAGFTVCESLFLTPAYPLRYNLGLWHPPLS